MAHDDHKGRDTLHILAQDGDVKLLQQALKTNSPNVKDVDGMLPLHYAAWYGHTACCQALLAAQADVNTFDHDGASALHAAAYNGQFACVVLLIDEGASAVMSDNDNQTPKDAAASEGHVDIVNYLRVMEEDQDREATMERLRIQFHDAESHCLAYKAEVTIAAKAAKKKVALLEKETKRAQKETISQLKKERKKSKSIRTTPQDAPKGPSTFSSLAMQPDSVKRTAGSQRRSSSPRTGAKITANTKKQPPSRVSSDSSGAPAQRPLPEVPLVSKEVQAEMLLAQFEADSGDGVDSLNNFLVSLDLKEFSRMFSKSQMTLEQLQRSSSEDLQRLGLPTGARKKIWSALHPQ